jgi:hypothetical protein
LSKLLHLGGILKQFHRSVVLFGMLVLSLNSWAQTASTSLRGVVKDSSGAVLSGAEIKVSNLQSGRVLQGVTNPSGAYDFPVLPPAHYLITVDSPGFIEQKKTAELLVDQPATINFKLGVSGNVVTVDVSASAQTLNLTDATLGSSENNDTIQALPSLERNVPDLLSLQPGVLFLGSDNTTNNTTNTGGDSRSGAVNGVRSDQSNVTIDGVDDNDQVNGYAFTGVLRETQDSVEEFRVTTANANATDGRSAGAQISLVTKSGSNKYHGSAYEYFRPSFTVANDWFLKQSQIENGEPNRPAKLIRNIFGGTASGAILKDKLFFFANYEGQRQAESQSVTRVAPTANFQQGLLGYTNSSGNTTTLSSSQLATLDAGCTVCNSTPYTANPGANPNILAYLQAMPTANGTTEGDGGINLGSYTFASPRPLTQNTSIVRLDWNISDRQQFFIRGNLQKDTMQGVEQFPGQGASSHQEDNTKGFILGHTWQITSHLVNDAHYGFIRQGFSKRGVASGHYVDFRSISSQTAETRSSINSVPVNNVIDNLTWIKGNHTLQAGGNWRLIHQNRSSDANSYNFGDINYAYLGGTVPSNGDVASGFQTEYEDAYASLTGSVAQVTDNYNYLMTSATTGTALPEGAFMARHFKANEFEWYVQDSWKVLPNLTLTFGVRHSLLQTPWETKGQEVAPTVDTHKWYQQREQFAQQGVVYEPSLSFVATGPYYGKPGYWAKAKDNFAPRVAVVYAPDPKTSIRAGAGIFYNHYGESLVNIFDQNGSFGMSSSYTDVANTYDYSGAPRYTARNTIPYTVGSSASTQAFPYTPNSAGFGVSWGIDNHLKTPYTAALNFSVQRELPGGFIFEAGYVGTLGRHLLQSVDLAEPVNYKDPGGGGSYFTAAAQLSKAIDANGGNYGANYTVPDSQYFDDVFPFMAGQEYTGETATQAIADLEWGPNRVAGSGATAALQDLDLENSSIYGVGGWTPKFFSTQFASLYALSTIGSSYYNAGQFTLHHPMSHGYQLDVSYTLSHSIDMGSDAERSTENSTSSALSSIINTWNTALNRASSDFDTRHMITADGIWKLPLGEGEKFLSHPGRLGNQVVGGWQLSGLARVTSGLPFSASDPNWNTDYQEASFAVVTGDVKVHRHRDSNGNLQFFDNQSAIVNGVVSGGPIRMSYAGETGQRNHFRGDGYFDIDAGLSKTWATPYSTHTKFAWEVYNVTNTARFDPVNITSVITSSSFGVASAMLTTPRRMQFSLRVDF